MPDSVIIPLSIKYAELYNIEGIHSAILALYSNAVRDLTNISALKSDMTNFSF